MIPGSLCWFQSGGQLGKQIQQVVHLGGVDHRCGPAIEVGHRPAGLAGANDDLVGLPVLLGAGDGQQHLPIVAALQVILIPA